MVVVAEEAIGVHLQPIPVGRGFQKVEKDLTIRIAAENRRPIDTAVHHMLPRTFVIFASWPWHAVPPMGSDPQGLTPYLPRRKSKSQPSGACSTLSRKSLS